ncbi:hypothetical protein [Acetonema longum]|uniref:Phage protein n=1 Tax=Acetonema longum DSM 6540 TaxID=1009370 RepID=F7NEA2_9FIRM|nr:hypothetical protein [Acetonema longum]EGO65614.1 phage protein [Acetonema longum DSM 6540]
MAQELTIKITANNDQVLQALKAVTDSMKGLNKEAVQSGTAMQNTFTRIPGVALKAAKAFTQVAQAAAAIAKPMIAYHASLQQSQAAFAAMLGSASAAQTFMNDLRRAAVDNNLDFPQLVTGAQRLMNLGWAARDIIPALVAAGNEAGDQANTFPAMAAAISSSLMIIAGSMTQGMFDALNAITAKVRDTTQQLTQALLAGNIGQALQNMVPPETFAALQAIHTQWTIFITDIQRLLTNLGAGSQSGLQSLANAFLNLLPTILKIGDIMVSLANGTVPILTGVLTVLGKTLEVVTRYSDNLVASFATYVIVSQILGLTRSLTGAYGSLKAAMIAITRITVFQNMISGAIGAIKGIKDLQKAVNALKLAFTSLSKGNVILLALSAVSLIFGDKIMDFIESKLSSPSKDDNSSATEDGKSNRDEAINRSQSALRITEAGIQASARKQQQDLEEKIAALERKKQQNEISLEQYHLGKSGYVYQQQQVDLSASHATLQAVKNTDYQDSTEKNERIAALEQEIAAKAQRLNEQQQNLADIERINAKLSESGLLAGEIGNVNIDLVSKAKEAMGQSLTKSGEEFQQALLDLFAQADDIATKLAAVRGDISSKQKAKLAAQYDTLAKTFRNNGSPEGAQMVEELKQFELLKLDFAQAQKDLELANLALAETQEGFMNDLANGSKTASEVTEDYAKQYKNRTASIVGELQRIIASAGNNAELSAQAKALLKKIAEGTNQMVEAVIKKIDSDLQAEIAKINVDPERTRMQKEDATEDAKRKAHAKTAAMYEKQARQYDAQAKSYNLMTPDEQEQIRKKNSGFDPTALAEEARKRAELNRELAETKTLTDEVSRASSQAFEDGLLTFLTDGVMKCQRLSDAFRNFANTILSEIQRVYAQAITKDIMAMFHIGGSYNSDSGKSSEEKMASGGVIESGYVRGPGTSTSDSILAWIDNHKKAIRISNGEFIMRGSAVAKYGKSYLDRLNRGLVPTELLPRFAAGGSLIDGSTLAALPGPQDIAATLSSGDTNIHLKTVNVTDPNEVGKYMQSRAGEKVLVNWIKNNAGAVRHVLSIRG